MALNDGRSVAFALLLAKAFDRAVPRPHLTTKITQSGYGPATFDVAMIEEDGKPSDRFAKVTVEIHRDSERAETLRRELDDAR